MKSGTILFAGTDIGLYGSPTFTLRRTPSPAPPAIASHWQIEIVVTVELRAEMPATVWAKARALQQLMASRSKDLLEIRDENGTSVSWMATPGDNGLQEAITRGSGRVDMNFSAMQPIAAEDFPLGIIVDPLNGDPVITIARPISWSDNHSISRADTRVAIRSEITTRIAFTARTAYADPLANTGTRAEQLMTEAARLKALSGKEARLMFAGYDEIVQFESFTAQPDEGWNFIELSAQCRHATLPGDDEAEVNFEVKSSEDPALGETRITVSGTVEAPDHIIAKAKVDAILAAYRTPARRVVRLDKRDMWADGEDATTPEWLGLSFDIELSESTTETRYSVKIDTKAAADGTRITYSGTAQAATMFELLATIETAAGSKHPVEVSMELGIQWATDDEGTLKLVSATFSREYQVASTIVRGELKQTAQRGAFGDWTVTLSGRVAAPDLATAQTIARAFIPAGMILRANDENESSSFYGAGPAMQLAALDFTYTWGIDHDHTSISYKDSDSPDYSRMVTERTISGTVWAASESAARTQMAVLLSGLGVASLNPSKQNLTSNRERSRMSSSLNIGDRWLSYDFSFTYETAITGTIGHDIIEAQWSIQRTGMVNHEPITEVPLTKPVKQVPFGYNMGRLVASGTIKARVQATARSWGQAKRARVSSVTGATGAEDPPDERMSQVMIPFNGTTAAFVEFSFTYSFRYADGLTGLWSSGLTL